MASLKNEEIRETFYYLSTLENVLNKEIHSVDGNKSNLNKIVPENIQNLHSDKKEKANSFMLSLSKIQYESSVITLLASFKKVVFSKYKTSYGEIKSLVGSQTKNTIAFYKAREKFVNSKKNENLSSIIDLIEGHVNDTLIKSLKMIKEQRDYIAHGKRFGTEPVQNLSLARIAETLDEIVSEIEK